MHSSYEVWIPRVGWQGVEIKSAQLLLNCELHKSNSDLLTDDRKQTILRLRLIETAIKDSKVIPCRFRTEFKTVWLRSPPRKFSVKLQKKTLQYFLTMRTAPTACTEFSENRRKCAISPKRLES